MDVKACLRSILFYLPLMFMICFSSGYGSHVGSECIHSGTGATPGICKDIHDCQTAIESLTKWQKHDLKNCGFNNFTEIVCCPLTVDTKSPTVSGQERLNGPDSPDDDDDDNEKPKKRRSLQACHDLSNQTVPVGLFFQIIGGHDAKEKEFPHMAALGYETDEGLEWNCGASIISNRYLLTAAHCTQENVQPTKARVGVTWLNATDAQDFDIVNITMHPGYNSTTKYHDLALIELRGRLTFNEEVYPACLYQEDDDPIGLIITGWGKNSSNDEGDRINLLQKASLVAVPNNECNETYVTRSLGSKTIMSSQLCAAGQRTDACWGDSGGPIQILERTGIYSIVGVISYGQGCGGRVPAVYTRVSKYLDWIENIVLW